MTFSLFLWLVSGGLALSAVVNWLVEGQIERALLRIEARVEEALRPVAVDGSGTEQKNDATEQKEGSQPVETS